MIVNPAVGVHDKTKSPENPPRNFREKAKQQQPVVHEAGVHLKVCICQKSRKKTENMGKLPENLGKISENPAKILKI